MQLLKTAYRVSFVLLFCFITGIAGAQAGGTRTKYENDKYRFGFYYPGEYLLERINDDEWVFTNTDKTWYLMYKIMHLNGKSYDSYVKSISTNIINSYFNQVSAEFGIPEKNPYGKYLIDGFEFDLFISSYSPGGNGMDKLLRSINVYLNIFRKTSQANFKPDGILIYTFGNATKVENNKMTKQFINTFVETVVFKEAIVTKPAGTTGIQRKPVMKIPVVRKPVAPPLTKKPVPTVPIVVKENGPAGKKGLYVFYGPNDKAGFKNELNEIVFEAVYSTHYVTWVRGFAALGKDNKWGFIDTTGRIVVPFIYEKTRDFSDGYAAVKMNGRWGFINTRNDVVVPFNYSDARSFTEGYAAVASGSEWGFIDLTNSLKIGHRYEYAFDFCEGAAAVKLDGLWGYINKEGTYLFTDKFEQAGFFKNGKAEVKKAGVGYVIDKTGKRAD